MNVGRALVIGGVIAYGIWLYRTAITTCARCNQLAAKGEFKQIVEDFDRPCRDCTEIGIENSVQNLQERLDDPELDPEELRLYWHYLFTMGRRSGMHRQVGQHLIDLIATKDPVLARYQSLGL